MVLVKYHLIIFWNKYLILTNNFDTQNHFQIDDPYSLLKAMLYECQRSCKFEYLCSSFVYSIVSLREKCPNTKLFLIRIFLYSDWIQRFTEKISIFSPNTGKYGPEITPYLDTFHAVYVRWRSALYWLRNVFIYGERKILHFFCQQGIKGLP